MRVPPRPLSWDLVILHLREVDGLTPYSPTICFLLTLLKLRQRQSSLLLVGKSSQVLAARVLQGVRRTGKKEPVSVGRGQLPG